MIKEEKFLVLRGIRFRVLRFVPNKKRLIDPFISLMKDCEMKLVHPISAHLVLPKYTALIPIMDYTKEYPCKFIENPKDLEIKNKVVFDSSWPLSKKRIKILTGNIIHGSEEWYYYYSQSNLKYFINKIKPFIKNTIGDISYNHEVNPKIAGELLGTIIKKMDDLLGDELK